MFNRHCCHSNDGDVTLMTNYQVYDCSYTNDEQYFVPNKQTPRNRGVGRGGGALGQVPFHFLYLGKKYPFSWMKVPYFHGIEVPFFQNLSGLFWSVPPHFPGASAASANKQHFVK